VDSSAICPPFGKMLKEIRLEQGIAQRALADMTSVSRNIIRKVESGERGECAHIGTIKRIAQVLGYELRLVKIEAG
jgi:transcriptional regulator with XRE-family HTH domain